MITDSEENDYICEKESLGCYVTEYAPPEESPVVDEKSEAEEGDISNEQIRWKKGYFGRTENIYAKRGAKYFCQLCSSIFNTRLSILTHSKMHKMPFCVLCGNYQSTNEDMGLHMFQCHPHEVYIAESSPARNSVDEVLDHPSSNDEAPATADQSIQEDFPEMCTTPKSRGRKNKIRNKALPKPITHFTKLVTSRFGRVITVKIPTY